MSKYEGEGGTSFSLYKDQLGAWMLSYYHTLTGDEDHRACSSERIARNFARDEWGVKQWNRRTKYSFEAFTPDDPEPEEEY